MKIRSIDHVFLSVEPGQVEQAREFYIRKLGFKEVKRPECLDYFDGFWCKGGNAELHIGVETGIERRQTIAHPAFVVEELPKWRAILEEAGAIVQVSVKIPGRERFEFRDPFGNQVEILEYNSV